MQYVFTPGAEGRAARLAEITAVLDPLIRPLLDAVKAMCAASREAAGEPHRQLYWSRYDFETVRREPCTEIYVWRGPDADKAPYHREPCEIGGEPYGEKNVACKVQPMMKFEFRTFINGENIRPLTVYDYNDRRCAGTMPGTDHPQWEPVFTSDSLDPAQAARLLDHFSRFMVREFGIEHFRFIQYFAGRNSIPQGPGP